MTGSLSDKQKNTIKTWLGKCGLGSKANEFINKYGDQAYVIAQSAMLSPTKMAELLGIKKVKSREILEHLVNNYDEVDKDSLNSLGRANTQQTKQQTQKRTIGNSLSPKQKASIENWLKNAKLGNKTDEFIKKYGDNAYVIVQNAMYPELMAKKIGGQYKNSKEALEYLLSADIDKDKLDSLEIVTQKTLREFNAEKAKNSQSRSGDVKTTLKNQAEAQSKATVKNIATQKVDESNLSNEADVEEVEVEAMDMSDIPTMQHNEVDESNLSNEVEEVEVEVDREDTLEEEIEEEIEVEDETIDVEVATTPSISEAEVEDVAPTITTEIKQETTNAGETKEQEKTTNSNRPSYSSNWRKEEVSNLETFWKSFSKEFGSDEEEAVYEILYFAYCRALQRKQTDPKDLVEGDHIDYIKHVLSVNESIRSNLELKPEDVEAYAECAKIKLTSFYEKGTIDPIQPSQVVITPVEPEIPTQTTPDDVAKNNKEEPKKEETTFDYAKNGKNLGLTEEQFKRVLVASAVRQYLEIEKYSDKKIKKACDKAFDKCENFEGSLSDWGVVYTNALIKQLGLRNCSDDDFENIVKPKSDGIAAIIDALDKNKRLDETVTYFGYVDLIKNPKLTIKEKMENTWNNTKESFVSWFTSDKKQVDELTSEEKIDIETKVNINNQKIELASAMREKLEVDGFSKIDIQKACDKAFAESIKDKDASSLDMEKWAEKYADRVVNELGIFAKYGYSRGFDREDEVLNLKKELLAKMANNENIAETHQPYAKLADKEIVKDNKKTMDKKSLKRHLAQQRAISENGYNVIAKVEAENADKTGAEVKENQAEKNTPQKTQDDKQNDATTLALNSYNQSDRC